MNVWYKPRLQSVDNIIKTQVLGGEVSPKQIDAVHEEALDVVLAALNGEAGLSGPDIPFLCAALHFHASCDCEYAVRFDGRTSVAGYDPEAYLAQYNAAGGDINRMRRVNYAKNKERINAQKRAAYEARKTREDQ